MTRLTNQHLSKLSYRRSREGNYLVLKRIVTHKTKTNVLFTLDIDRIQQKIVLSIRESNNNTLKELRIEI